MQTKFVSVLAGLILAGAVLATRASAEQAAESVGCQVVDLLSSTPAPPAGRTITPTYYAVITNSTAATIPAESAYTYVIAGRSFAYRSMMMLPTGRMLNIKLASSEPVGACQATVVPAQPDNVGITGGPLRP